MAIMITFFAGLITMALLDALIDLIDAITERIRISNEERRAKLGDD